MEMEFYGDERDYEPGGIYYDGSMDVLDDDDPDDDGYGREDYGHEDRYGDGYDRAGYGYDDRYRDEIRNRY